MIDLLPILTTDSPEPLYLQLYKYIRRQIESGDIPAHAKMPSKRKLANSLKISQNTVTTAYQQLVAEGYLDARTRSGHYVGTVAEDGFVPRPLRSKQTMKEWADERDGYDFVFDHASVDCSAFPLDSWRRLYKDVLFETESLVTLGDPQGDYGLRNEISEYLYRSRGVQCSPGHLIVGSGTQTLLLLLVQIIGWNRKYAMEDPGYSKARKVLQHNGAQIEPIPLDQEGLSIRALQEQEVDIVYVTPSHQFPTGIVMPISRRYELLQWAAEKSERYIIEDDYDSEFRYSSKPIPSLQGLDTNGKVIYMGTFSKALMPSLRLSYMVLPTELLDIYRVRFSFYSQTVSRIEQQVMERFMREGFWASHIQKMRNLYERKKEVLVSSLRRSFGNELQIEGLDGGLHVIVGFDRPISERELIRRAKQEKVLVQSLSLHYADNTRPELCNMVLLGFANLTADQIQEGVLRLERAWSDIGESP
ncbi:PLP-dependent aminotransferase family protein [Paenibacillus mesophilus]|uniref:MocR-like pyridoxine biosynthesis transcription factor PdxR n=1 Tax=Paenibacillus mesophilus TaxID=2582849 RepID=UPI00110DA344|nr:PLP-dependent aminotransferase family protein [Paenibacillus mesophilus]TMV43298.1 PLP-dependent aminotransferase family protein [Paenibacillus mesophilus]